MLERDLGLITQNYLRELPEEKRFIYKWVKSEARKKFFRYYDVYQSTYYYVEHTGFLLARVDRNSCSQIYKNLLSIYEKATKDMDLETLAMLDNPTITLKELFKRHGVPRIREFLTWEERRQRKKAKEEMNKAKEEMNKAT